jgi:hypothetical protein
MFKPTQSRVIGFVLAAGVGVAIACGPSAPPQCGTPGWNYGGANCGNVPPSTSTTALQCDQCCLAAVNSNALPAGEVLNCQAFCAQANFNPPSGPGGVWWAIGHPFWWLG